MHALLELLGVAIDYAGLFPPAGLAMPAAVRNHVAYAASPERWMLGRFVVPFARLDELARADAALGEGRGDPLRLSVLLGEDVGRELALAAAFEDAHRGRVRVEAVELKADDAAGVERAGQALDAARHGSPPSFAGAAFVEVPLAADPEPLLAAARRARVALKVRTGGVAAEAFPPAEQVLRFVARCAAHRVPWKATAGLHHALRGEHPLTYEPGAPCGTMLGFLSLFLADAFLRAGASPDDVRPLLEERDGTTLAFDDDGASWRGPHGPLRVDVAHIREARLGGLQSFGSCSFEEPVAELHALGFLKAATPACS